MPTDDSSVREALDWEKGLKPIGNIAASDRQLTWE